MLTKFKYSFSGLAVASVLALSACASQAPRVGNSALGFVVTSYDIAADESERALSDALGFALSGVPIAMAMEAKADVTIDVVRYNSPLIGIFYGGQHYASLSVVLSDISGARLSSFPLYVAANGARSSADADLANAAVKVIAAKAANAYMPIRTRAAAPLPVEPVVQAPAVDVPVVEAPAVQVPTVKAAIVETVSPEVDQSTPCVIGPDGRCIVL